MIFFFPGIVWYGVGVGMPNLSVRRRRGGRERDLLVSKTGRHFLKIVNNVQTIALETNKKHSMQSCSS